MSVIPLDFISMLIQRRKRVVIVQIVKEVLMGQIYIIYWIAFILLHLLPIIFGPPEFFLKTLLVQ